MQRSRLSRSPRFTIPRWFLAGLTLAALGVSLRGQEAADLQALPVPEEVLPPLESILKTAGERAPELVQIGLDRRIANEELTIARSRLYPSVGVAGTSAIGMSTGRARTTIRTPVAPSPSGPVAPFTTGAR